MLQKLINFFFKLTFAEKKLLLKDVFFTDENENITRAVRLIQKQGYLINSEKRIIDVGAFDGSTAKLFAKAFPSAKIYAFEANALVFKLAQQNCKAIKNIKLYNYAVSDKHEMVTLNITSNDVSSSINSIDTLNVDKKEYKSELDLKSKVLVEAVTLDEFMSNEDVLLLKIDTQGHELKVLEGAKQTLKRTQFVLIEMSNHSMYINGCKYYEVDEWLRKNNFVLIDIVVTYRKNGVVVSEYDAIYSNNHIT